MKILTFALLSFYRKGSLPNWNRLETTPEMVSCTNVTLFTFLTVLSTLFPDDTLLDYILVMVVNQKTKFEMKHNLSLFLSRNTEEFVDWLFELLAEARENTIPSTSKSVFRFKMLLDCF